MADTTLPSAEIQTNEPQRGPIEALYLTELDLVEKYQAQAADLTNPDLAGNFQHLFTSYKRLLKQTMKMTALSDAAQRQMQRTSRELSRAMDDLTRVNQHLSQLNEEKNEILALASHDMRTPLSGIVGLSDILLESPSLSPEENRDFLQNIRTSAEDLCDMINDLLDIYRADSVDQESRSVETTLHDIADAIENEHRLTVRAKEVTLVIQQAGADRSVPVDKPLFLRVVNNLVSNAIRFTPAGKNIKVTLGLLENSLGLEVADEGAGMSEEDRQSILTGRARLRVRSTSRSGSAGVGLLIVKRIIDKRGGYLQCESELGKGTVFSVQFPLG